MMNEKRWSGDEGDYGVVYFLFAESSRLLPPYLDLCPRTTEETQATI